MGLMQWRDEFKIGIAEVDHDHRELIGLINELHEEAADGDTVEEVVAALGEISARIAAHFALEEKNMERLGYAAAAAHKSDHELLLDEIAGIMDDVYASGRYEADGLSKQLMEWFGRHFRTHDAELHRWLEQAAGRQ